MKKMNIDIEAIALYILCTVLATAAFLQFFRVI